MPDLILVLNAGSSSLKFGVFACSETAVTEVARGKYSDLHGTPHFSTSTGTRKASGLSLETGSSLRHVLEHLTGWLASEGHMSSIVAAGHRIVHGGTKYHAPVRLTPDVLDELDALTPLAPLHQPASLEPVRVLRDVLTDLLQIGCFDTAFHHHLGIEARSYALPIRYQTQGIRKFGFHGLSYQHVASELAAISPRLKGKRTVVAHLGNGCSLCAMRDGTSVDTTMGYTPLDGLMMGTRSGSLDPGLLLHLIRELKMSPDAVEHLLYNQSGLLGVSGISADMHTLLDSSDPHALAAIDLFVYRAVAEAARMTAALEGLEVLVFTGGIGENSWQIRERICARLAWLGVLLDHRANRAGATIISKPESKVDVHVVAANEEIVIAQSVAGVMKIQGA